MAYDKYKGESIFANQSYTYAEEADFSTADYTFNAIPTALSCEQSGSLKVDMAGGSTNVTVYVLQGLNKLRVTKIYNAGSTIMGVTGLY